MSPFDPAATPIEATDRLGLDGVLAAFDAVRGLGLGGLAFRFHCDVCHGPTLGTDVRCGICLRHTAKGWRWNAVDVRWEKPA